MCFIIHGGLVIDMYIKLHSFELLNADITCIEEHGGLVIDMTFKFSLLSLELKDKNNFLHRDGAISLPLWFCWFLTFLVDGEVFVITIVGSWYHFLKWNSYYR